MFTNFKKMKIALLSTLLIVSLWGFLFPSLALAQSQYSFDAVVYSNGTLARGSSVYNVSHLSTGRYEVTFYSDVSQCAYTATIGDPSNGLVYYPGLVYTAGGHGYYGGADGYGVYVETKNTGGGLTDFPFHLNVTC